MCNIILGYAMVEIVNERSNTTQRNNETYRKQKHSDEKEIQTGNEIYVSNFRSLQLFLISPKEVVRYEMLMIT